MTPLSSIACASAWSSPLLTISFMKAFIRRDLSPRLISSNEMLAMFVNFEVSILPSLPRKYAGILSSVIGNHLHDPVAIVVSPCVAPLRVILVAQGDFVDRSDNAPSVVDIA